jgi:hypothetical protein
VAISVIAAVEGPDSTAMYPATVAAATANEVVLHVSIEIVRKPLGIPTFHVLPRRWVVERTFARLYRASWNLRWRSPA